MIFCRRTICTACSPVAASVTSITLLLEVGGEGRADLLLVVHDEDGGRPFAGHQAHAMLLQDARLPAQ